MMSNEPAKRPVGRPKNIHTPLYQGRGNPRYAKKVCAQCGKRLPQSGFAGTMMTKDRLMDICLDCLDDPLTSDVAKQGLDIHADDSYTVD